MGGLLLIVSLLLQNSLGGQTAGGTIAGRLLSKDGKPASGVRVSVVGVPERTQPVTGVQRIDATTLTESSGRFRLEAVPPGRYYVIAGLDFPSYYPGVLSANAAAVITVMAGATNSGVDFSVVPSEFTVRGRIIADERASVVMSEQSVALRGRRVTPNPDGTFEFDEVQPGRYSVGLISARGNPSTSITVVDRDVVVELVYGETMTGTALWQSGQPASGVRVYAINALEGESTADVRTIHASTQTDSSGQFQFDAVVPGRYYVAAGPINFPVYYPGVAATSAATVVTVKARATNSGIDFSLAEPPSVTPALVAGTYESCPFPCKTTTLSANGRFEVVLRGDLFTGETARGQWEVDSDGRVLLNSDRHPQVKERISQIAKGIRFRVVDQDGKTPPFVSVDLKCEFSAVSLYIDQGEFLPQGPGAVSLEPNGDVIASDCRPIELFVQLSGMNWVRHSPLDARSNEFLFTLDTSADFDLTDDKYLWKPGHLYPVNRDNSLGDPIELKTK